MKDTDHNTRSRTAAAQVRLLYNNVLPGLLVSLLTAILVVIILWNYLSQRLLITWLAANGIGAFLIVIVHSIYWHLQGDRVYQRCWLYLYLAGAWLHGALWGFLVFHSAGVEVIGLKGFLAFVVSGLSAGGLFTMSAVRSAVIPYCLLILGPFAYVLLTDYEDRLYMGMGILVALYLILLIRSALRFYQLQIESIRIQLESDDMFSFLRASKEDTDRLRDHLESEIREYAELHSGCEELVERIPLPLCIIGRDECIDLANPAMQKLTGRDPAGLRASRFTDLAHPDDAGRIRASFNRITQGLETAEFTCRIRTGQEQYKFLEWRVVPGNGRLYAIGHEKGDTLK